MGLKWENDAVGAEVGKERSVEGDEAGFRGYRAVSSRDLVEIRLVIMGHTLDATNGRSSEGCAIG